MSRSPARQALSAPARAQRRLPRIAPRPFHRGAGQRQGACRARSITARVLLVLAISLSVPCALLAQASEDPISVRQRELRDLKKEMEANRKKIEELQRKEKKLGALDQRLQRDKQLTERYLVRLEEQERALLTDLTGRQSELGRMTGEHEKMSALLRRRLRNYQRSRSPQTAELLVSSRSFAQLLARGALLARAIQRDRGDLLWLRQQRDDLAVATSLLESRRRGLDLLQSEKEREKSRIESKSRKTRAEIEDVRETKDAFEKRQNDLVQAEQKIRTLLARLEEDRRKKAKDAKAPRTTGPGLAPLRGSLPWPTEGSVVGSFGVEMHPRFKTKVPSNGIDIAAPSGAPVKAVAAGTAEFVDWLPGYGRCVILNHGGGYYTLYAHCSKVLVAAGDKVDPGRRIAEVGDTDSVKGTCLHFEIRLGQDAMDPEEWLK